jgi:hypothetical protein
MLKFNNPHFFFVGGATGAGTGAATGIVAGTVTGTGAGTATGAAAAGALGAEGADGAEGAAGAVATTLNLHASMLHWVSEARPEVLAPNGNGMLAGRVVSN